MGPNRIWNAAELHGPIDWCTAENDRCQGYDKHLDSYATFTRTEVELEKGKVTYTVRELNTWKVLQVYKQDW